MNHFADFLPSLHSVLFTMALSYTLSAEVLLTLWDPRSHMHMVYVPCDALLQTWIDPLSEFKTFTVVLTCPQSRFNQDLL